MSAAGMLFLTSVMNPVAMSPATMMVGVELPRRPAVYLARRSAWMPWKVALTWILPLLAALNWLIRLLKATPLAAPRPCQTVMSVTPLAFFRADASGTDDPLPPPLDVELQAAEPAMTVTAMAAAANLFFMTLPSDQSIGSVRRDRAVQRRTPRVRPLMRKRWAKTTRRIVGTTTRTAPAKMT